MIRTPFVLSLTALLTHAAATSARAQTDLPTPEIVEIQGGVFFMGSQRGPAQEKPIHAVQVSDFWISKHEVTHDEGRFFVAGSPARAVGWSELAAFAHAPGAPEGAAEALAADVDFRPSGETFPFGTHLCAVEIEPDTGEVTIARYISVDDCGEVINPLLAEGQVHGGLAQEIAQALYEEAVYDADGNLLTPSLLEYAVPRADMLPRYELHRTVTPTPVNPLGVNSLWIKRPAWESVLEEMRNPFVRADAGRFPHRVAVRIACAIRSARFRGEGGPSPHPSPAALRAASAHEGLFPQPVEGIGEAANIGSTPAVANAVMDARRPFGVEHLDTPLTPEKVWRAMRGQSE